MLDTSDSEFEDWAKTLRKEVTEQWDEFGNPPVIGKNYDKIIDTLLDVGGKDFVMKNSTIELLNHTSENSTELFNKIINIGGKDYIKNLIYIKNDFNVLKV